jgi:hypothetical protein
VKHTTTRLARIISTAIQGEIVNRFDGSIEKANEGL